MKETEKKNSAQTPPFPSILLKKKKREKCTVQEFVTVLKTREKIKKSNKAYS